MSTANWKPGINKILRKWFLKSRPGPGAVIESRSRPGSGQFTENICFLINIKLNWKNKTDVTANN